MFDTRTPMPPLNFHDGFLFWTLAAPVTFAVLCRVCPGRRTDLPLVVDEWRADEKPGDWADSVWARHCSTPPPDRLPTLAQLTTGGTT